MFSENSARLVAHGRDESGFGTSWLEEALRCKAAVVRLRDDKAHLSELGEYFDEGAFAGYVSAEECKRLGDYYDAAAKRHLRWSKDPKKPIHFGRNLESSLTEWLGNPGPPPSLELYDFDLEVGNVWQYVATVGREVFGRSLERTKELGFSGFRVSDFAWAMHLHLFDSRPPRERVSFAQLLKKAKGHPEERLASQLCRCICEKYAENFAGLTTGRQFAVAVDPRIRRLTLGHRPTFAEGLDPKLTFLDLGEIELPTTKEFLATDPQKLESIRAKGEVYRARLAEWKAASDSSEDSAQYLADALKGYAKSICREVTPGEPRRPKLRMIARGTATSGGLAAASLASYQVLEYIPDVWDRPEAVAATITTAATTAGIALVRKQIASGQRRRKRTWTVEGSSFPSGASAEAPEATRGNR